MNAAGVTTRGCRKKAKKRKRTVSNEEMAAMVRRVLRALGRRVGREYGVVDDLLLFAQIDSELKAQFTEAVGGLRQLGCSNTDIARVLGVSRQDVAKRWPLKDGRP